MFFQASPWRLVRSSQRFVISRKITTSGIIGILITVGCCYGLDVIGATEAKDAGPAASNPVSDSPSESSPASPDQSSGLLSYEQCVRNLSAGTSEEKRQAIRSLMHYRDSALEPILNALQDEDAAVRAEAIKALGELAPLKAEVVVPRLLKCIEEDDGYVDEQPNWIRSLQAIGKYREKALPIIEQQWEGGDSRKRAILCLVCYEIGPCAAPMVPKLMALAEEGPDICRRTAIGALMAIGPDAAPAVPSLRKHLYHEDFHTQYWACRALAAIGPAALPAVPDLVDRLKNGVASVRRNAAAALGKLGPEIGPDAIAALIQAVDDPLQPVREQAVLALGRLGPDAAAQARQAIENSHEKRPIFPRSAATWAIWRLGGPIEPLVESLVTEIKEGVYREEATELLRTMGDAGRPVQIKLKESLAAVAETNPEEAANIRETLREIDQEPQTIDKSSNKGGDGHPE